MSEPQVSNAGARTTDGTMRGPWHGLRAAVAALSSLRKFEPPAPRSVKGFFTDTTLCIGCKACEVACKEWNQLPSEPPRWTGTSYDNTGALSATTWRHVLFVEQIPESRQTPRWLLMSDVCKHCANAPCQEVCPTGAIIRTEFDSVYVQDDVCNGCGYCVVACPFGVIDRSPFDGGAHKCTLCYDRLKVGDEPACARVCPTRSIQFGDLAELRARAEQRIAELHARGETSAYLYGADERVLEGGLHAFFLLVDRPDVYNLPAHPRRPVRNARRGYLMTAFTAAVLMVIGMLGFARR
ncbi:MAG TPA: 4Fe-4S dicluster domain-containing protein [Chloroflexota bacterium]|nr:4Fe-4S dicluster domain-containing protein [Chloroflexota bacterium]